MHWTASLVNSGSSEPSGPSHRELVVFRVRVAREVVTARGGADRRAVAAVVQIDGRMRDQSCWRHDRTCTCRVCHRPYSGRRRCRSLRWRRNHRSVSISTRMGTMSEWMPFKTVDGAVDGCAILSPTAHRRFWQSPRAFISVALSSRSNLRG